MGSGLSMNEYSPSAGSGLTPFLYGYYKITILLWNIFSKTSKYFASSQERDWTATLI
jgi:hypothetical protein